MLKSMKILGAIAALLLPLVAGWFYTAGASVDEEAGLFGGLFDMDTVDEFTIDGYDILREGHGGVVTMSVTGPDGETIAPDDLPADIAAQVEFFEHDWVEPEPRFETDDDDSCWLPGDLQPGDNELVVSSDDDSVRVIEILVDDDGTETVTAVEFTREEFTEDHDKALHTGQLRLADIDGGTPIEPCNP